MKRVLILTKNVLLDKELEERLKSLNYEVFVSHQLFRSLLESKQLVISNLFKIIVFSKTICNDELELALECFDDKSIIVLREEEQVDLKHKEYWRNNGISGWLSTKDTYQQLREYLQQFDLAEERFGKEKPIYEFDHLLMRFSKNERIVLELLYNARGGFLGREDLAKKMWGIDITNSRLSQMTQLIQKLRRRFEKYGLDKDLIVTSWGKGYCLAEEFYETYPSKNRVKNFNSKDKSKNKRLTTEINICSSDSVRAGFDF